MQVMGQMGDHLTHEEAEQMIKEVDVNNDGHIDYEEFVVLMLKQKWAQPRQTCTYSKLTLCQK